MKNLVFTLLAFAVVFTLPLSFINLVSTPPMETDTFCIVSFFVHFFGAALSISYALHLNSKK
jgi:hypothetical protein